MFPFFYLYDQLDQSFPAILVCSTLSKLYSYIQQHPQMIKHVQRSRNYINWRHPKHNLTASKCITVLLLVVTEQDQKNGLMRLSTFILYKMSFFLQNLFLQCCSRLVGSGNKNITFTHRGLRRWFSQLSLAKNRKSGQRRYQTLKTDRDSL